jgi:hypothetical protein
MKPQVLILTSLYDFSADIVAIELESKGVPFVRVNKEHISDYEYSVDPVSPSINVRANGKLIAEGDELISVWFRQPVFLRNTPSTPLSSHEQLYRSQWSAFLRGLSVYEQIAWMNWPQATYLAESKPYQLYMANLCGLRVPKTLVTNDANSIKNNFTAQIVVKSLDTVLLRDQEDSLFTYTSECDPNQITQDSVQTVPLLAQEYLCPKIDYRVTIIGRDVFAVKILCDGDPVSGDWRVENRDKLQYIDCNLPKGVEEGCRRLMDKLGLNFGAIDLVETNDGFVFIEINPTGEWGWLNTEDRGFGEKIASWLARGN